MNLQLFKFRYQLKLNFRLFLTQKGTRIGHFGARDDRIIKMRKNFEASEVAEAAEVNEASEVFKVWKKH